MKQDTYYISPAHYNDISEDVLQGSKTILEFGPATGLNHLISIHRDFFIKNNKAGRYLGIDLEPYEERYFNIQQGDIRYFQTDQKFDIVLALHVIEHIEFDQWASVLEKLCSFVASGGYLILGTPHNEPPNTTELHLVWRITPTTFLDFLPDAEFKEVRNKYPFAEDGARFAWALLRFIKRWLTRHPYVRPYARLLVVWKKED